LNLLENWLPLHQIANQKPAMVLMTAKGWTDMAGERLRFSMVMV